MTQEPSSNLAQNTLQPVRAQRPQLHVNAWRVSQPARGPLLVSSVQQPLSHGGVLQSAPRFYAALQEEATVNSGDEEATKETAVEATKETGTEATESDEPSGKKWKKKFQKDTKLTDEAVELLKKWARFKRARDYENADALRDKLRTEYSLDDPQATAQRNGHLYGGIIYTPGSPVDPDSGPFDT